MNTRIYKRYAELFGAGGNIDEACFVCFAPTAAVCTGLIGVIRLLQARYAACGMYFLLCAGALLLSFLIHTKRKGGETDVAARFAHPLVVGGFIFALSALFFVDGGVSGGVPMLFVLAFVLTPVFLPLREAVLFLILEFLAYDCDVVLSLLYPDSVGTEASGAFDLCLTMALVMVFLGAMCLAYTHACRLQGRRLEAALAEAAAGRQVDAGSADAADSGVGERGDERAGRADFAPRSQADAVTYIATGAGGYDLTGTDDGANKDDHTKSDGGMGKHDFTRSDSDISEHDLTDPDEDMAKYNFTDPDEDMAEYDFTALDRSMNMKKASEGNFIDIKETVMNTSDRKASRNNVPDDRTGGTISPEAETSLRYLEGIDYDAAVTACGSAATFVEALQIFYDTLPQKADDIERFAAAGDYHNYRILVHALKNAARLVGAPELSKAAEHLEKAGNEKNAARIAADTPALLASYRAYLAILQPVCGRDEAALPEMPKERLQEIYGKILQAAEHFDLDGVDEQLAHAEKYRIPDAEKERFERVRSSALAADWGALKALLSR